VDLRDGQPGSFQVLPSLFTAFARCLLVSWTLSQWPLFLISSNDDMAGLKGASF
jgi:hypothetical protein